jgi:inorganic pyrophosphatase
MSLNSDFFKLVRAHPWHGLDIGDNAPREITAYIEIVPSDTVKYELDKASGYLKVDRSQEFSNVYPTLYGLIPQTYCGEQIAKHCMKRTGRKGIVGDGDPLDICVLAEKSFTHGDFVVRVRPIGGLRMIDAGQADDKIIAVLERDTIYGHIHDISQCPPAFVARLEHHFLTYELAPEEPQHAVEIAEVYGRLEAFEVIERSREDYGDKYSELARLLVQLR